MLIWDVTISKDGFLLSFFLFCREKNVKGLPSASLHSSPFNRLVKIEKRRHFDGDVVILPDSLTDGVWPVSMSASEMSVTRSKEQCCHLF